MTAQAKGVDEMNRKRFGYKNGFNYEDFVHYDLRHNKTLRTPSIQAGYWRERIYRQREFTLMFQFNSLTLTAYDYFAASNPMLFFHGPY
jgi:hypothetical protein